MTSDADNRLKNAIVNKECRQDVTGRTYLGQDRTDRVTGMPTFHRHHDATNRHDQTYTWPGSNQPQASVLTPSDVPPPLHSSHPALSLFGCPPCSNDILHLVLVHLLRVLHIPTVPFLGVFSLFFFETAHDFLKKKKKNTRFSRTFPTLSLLLF